MVEHEPDGLPSSEPRLSIRILVWASEVVAVVGAERLFQHCAVFVADERRGVLVLAGQIWGSGEDTGEVVPGHWVVPFEGSVCGSVYQTGRAALVQDIADAPSYRTYPGSRAMSELAVAIPSGGRRIGALNLESPRLGTFGIADLERLTEHAERAGLAFEEAGLASDLES